ncbi:MAG: Demethylmenaquinone methyltransferase [Chlamydiae bacterium]|nr:Demethylmenaquinone methyltransferase [Chlamydiota bacterium]
MAEYTKEDPKTIQEMFGNIAKQYDRANSLLSFNMHKRWNRELVKFVTENASPKKYLDLCCGTGEIAYTFLDQVAHPCEVFFLDFCPEMLECAKKKATQKDLGDHRLYYLQADAQKIPLPSNSIESVTIAYGIRNVQDPLKCAKEVFRVLQPKGRFGILELTKPTNFLMKLGHKMYLKALLPILGKWIASNRQAYQYLSGSIQSFISAEEMEHVLKDAGFHTTSRRPLSGGIATIILGEK